MLECILIYSNQKHLTWWIYEDMNKFVCRENRFWTFLEDKQKAVPEEANLPPPGLLFASKNHSETQNVEESWLGYKMAV